MTEIINDIVAQIDQIISWLRVTVYLVMGICVVWLIGFLRRNLGLDTHSIELRRIDAFLRARIQTSRLLNISAPKINPRTKKFKESI